MLAFFKSPLKLHSIRDIFNLKDALHHAETFVEETEFPNPPMLVKDLHVGDIYACVSVVLSQLHNLQTLQLNRSFVRESGRALGVDASSCSIFSIKWNTVTHGR